MQFLVFLIVLTCGRSCRALKSLRQFRIQRSFSSVATASIRDVFSSLWGRHEASLGLLHMTAQSPRDEFRNRAKHLAIAAAVISSVTSATLGSSSSSSSMARDLPDDLPLPCLADLTRLDVTGSLTLPLELIDDNGASILTVSYTLFPGGSALKSIVDTGSGFCIVPTVSTRLFGVPSKKELSLLKPSGLADTIEIFGGQEFDTQWRTLPSQSNQGSGPVKEVKELLVATVGSDVNLPPGGVFFGLIKQGSAFIRPTFLGATNVTSIRIDTSKQPKQKMHGEKKEKKELEVKGDVEGELILSSKSLIPKDATNAVQMIDLRPMGDSVRHYAARVKRLYVNGQCVSDNLPLCRPIYCVFDTGTSGCAIQDSLFFDEDFPLPPRSVEVILENERGDDLSISARATRDEMFVVTPIKVPWFNRELNRRPELLPPYDDNGRFEPIVVVLGLAFMRGKRLTLDIEDSRVELV